MFCVYSIKIVDTGSCARRSCVTHGGCEGVECLDRGIGPGRVPLPCRCGGPLDENVFYFV